MTATADILDRVKRLPPPSATATRLIAVITDPESSVEDIIEVIKYDPGLTSEVLRICNSAYYGLQRRVSSLQEAIVRLGSMRVLQLVMSVHTTTLLSRPQPGYGLEPGVLWRHCVAVAIAAARFGTRMGIANEGLIFTAGLLHDIGKIVLNEYVGRDFQAIVEKVTQQRASFIEAERDVLGISHEEIGARLAERWQLPEPIIRCIRYHHEPHALDPPDVLVDGVYLANCLCLLLGIGLGEDGLYYRADPAVLQRYALKERDLQVVGLETLDELQRVEQAMGTGEARPAGKT